jgi:hypothetical protein
MRPVLSLGRNTVAQSLARRAPLLQSHTKNYSTPAEQGRATASHHNHTTTARAWTVERFGISSTLLICCRQAGPLRAPLCPPAGLTKLGQGHHGHPGHGLCLPSCRALLSWMLRCIFGGAALGRAPCGLGNSCCLQETKALHGTAPCDCDIRIRNEDTCEVWILLHW